MVGEKPTDQEPGEELPLSQAAQYLLEECRMVLPGLQALFGFQLIAVFNPRFAQQLSPAEQRLHLLAIALAAVAIALIMTPAAYHRQTGPRQVSETFIRLSTRLLLWSMGPLAVSMCVDLYLVGRVILDGVGVPLLAAALFAVFITLWFLLPRMRALQRAVRWRT
jgi:Family of unknown function (DUF6328)